VAELCAAHPKVTLVVDSAAGVDALAATLRAAELTAMVLLDLDVGQRRCGVLPGEAPALAAYIARSPALRLVGVQGYEGHLQHVLDAGERERLCHEAMARLTGTAAVLRAAGHDILRVTTGGTGTALICKQNPGVTEVQPGSFVFMDAAYRRVLGAAYDPALCLVSTVISRPRPNEAIIDAGLKSLSTDSGPAEPRTPGLAYRPAGDEHGVLSWDASFAGPEPVVGDRIELIPSHIDTTVNLHDEYHLHRAGWLEDVWPIEARGKVQ
jgi:D-serine deaminase-like pyridoxal phosphate-dependent protein